MSGAHRVYELVPCPSDIEFMCEGDGSFCGCCMVRFKRDTRKAAGHTCVLFFVFPGVRFPALQFRYKLLTLSGKRTLGNNNLSTRNRTLYPPFPRNSVFSESQVQLCDHFLSLFPNFRI